MLTSFESSQEFILKQLSLINKQISNLKSDDVKTGLEKSKKFWQKCLDDLESTTIHLISPDYTDELPQKGFLYSVKEFPNHPEITVLDVSNFTIDDKSFNYTSGEIDDQIENFSKLCAIFIRFLPFYSNVQIYAQDNIIISLKKYGIEVERFCSD